MAEHQDTGVDADDAVDLADHPGSVFGADLPPDLQDALAALLESRQDIHAGDAEVVINTETDTAAGTGEASVQASRNVLPTVLAMAAGIVGGALTAEQPLMEANLDSLGAAQLHWHNTCTAFIVAQRPPSPCIGSVQDLLNSEGPQHHGP